MPTVLLILVSGAIVGYFLRRFPFVRQIGAVTGIVVMLLFFFLGVSVGSNPEVVAKFRSIGSDAFVIGFAGTVGSVIGGWIVYRFFSKKEDKPE